MTRLHAIERILACRRLADPAQNTNEHERATAIRMADLLIKKYKITQAELGAKIKEDGFVPPRPSPSWSDVGVIFSSNGISPSRGWPTEAEWKNLNQCEDCGIVGSKVKWHFSPMSKHLCGDCEDDY